MRSLCVRFLHVVIDASIECCQVLKSGNGASIVEYVLLIRNFLSIIVTRTARRRSQNINMTLAYTLAWRCAGTPSGTTSSAAHKTWHHDGALDARRQGEPSDAEINHTQIDTYLLPPLSGRAL